MSFNKPSPILAARTVAALCLAGYSLLAIADVKTTSRMTISFSMGSAATPKVETLTSYYKAGMMRVDGSDGHSYIMDAKNKKTTMLNSKDKTYTEMTMEGMMGGAQSKIVKDMHMTMSGHMKPTSMRKTIAGKPASKYVLDFQLGANIPAMGGQPSPGSMSGKMTGDFWTTTALKEHYSADQMMGAMSQMMQGLSMFGDTHKIMKEFTNFKGFPLSTDMNMVMTMKPNKTGPQPPAGTPMTFSITMKNEVLTVAETTVSADLFKIPAGYKKADPPKFGGMGGAH
jgi:hypothetical protein